jgi:hypothetical protein
MKFKQACISRSLAGLTKGYRKKYNLRTYFDSLEPLLFIGMYRQKDFDLFLNHKGEKAIVYCGSDARDLPIEWIEEIKKADANYSISNFTKQSLLNHNINSEYYPINATIADDWKPCKNGDNIYWYYSPNCPEIYGAEFIDEIEKRTGFNIIKAHLKSHTQKELESVYASCFLNLRLTQHDGCPNSNLQMGLMGRASIYNGDLPHSIAWNNIDDICENIITVYNQRHKPNDIISKDFYNFVTKY